MGSIATINEERFLPAKHNGNGLQSHHNHNSMGDLRASDATLQTEQPWHFDTLQVHSGLEDETAHGQNSLPIYNSASFRFRTSKSIEEAYSFEDGPKSQYYMYSRLSNVS